MARATLLDIPVVEEKYGLSFLASLGIHLASVALILLAPYILPRAAPIQLSGSGPGGGSGGDSYAVGIADDLGGGAGMTKPAVNPQPPALPADAPAKEAPKPDAVSLPDTLKPPKTSKVREQASTTARKGATDPKSNVIPTAPQPGAGGTGGVGGGSGGGRGGGIGVSIGSGSGGVGDHWYARGVEMRISRNWVRPGPQVQLQIIYSFYIAPDGTIYDISKEKSSGNEYLDLQAERAIRASNPLSAPPPEFRGRPVQFVAQFVYPPNQ